MLIYSTTLGGWIEEKERSLVSETELAIENGNQIRQDENDLGEFDYSKMCMGSEMLGTRENNGDLRCRKCNEIIPTIFQINLVPVHEVK